MISETTSVILLGVVGAVVLIAMWPISAVLSRTRGATMRVVFPLVAIVTLALFEGFVIWARAHR